MSASACRVWRVACVQRHTMVLPDGSPHQQQRCCSLPRVSDPDLPRRACCPRRAPRALRCRVLQLSELVCLPASCQRVFFGKMDNAAETVWLICRQGDSSPNRQYFSEPFEDVLLRGHCSEVRITACMSRLGSVCLACAPHWV